MQVFKRITLAFTALLMATMACANIPVGEIISSEEATQRAKPTATTEVLELTGAKYTVGDAAVIIGGRYGALVPLFGNPGDRFFSSQVLHGTNVTVLGLRDLNGVVWYRVEGMMGEGWLIEANLVTEEEYTALEAAKNPDQGEPEADSTDDSSGEGSSESSGGD